VISNERFSNSRDKSANADTIEHFRGRREKAIRTTARLPMGRPVSPQSSVGIEIFVPPKNLSFHYSGAAA
jgi:hypothetical protein